MPEREKIMDKQMMSMEELEQVNGGYKYEKKKTERGHSNDGHKDAIIDGIIYVGYKTVEGARYVWNHITSLF